MSFIRFLILAKKIMQVLLQNLGLKVLLQKE